MDWDLLVSGVTLVTFLAVLAFGYVKFRQISGKFDTISRFLGSKQEDSIENLMKTFAQRAKAWMFVDSGKVSEAGAKIFVPSEEFKALVALAIPEVIGQGMLWAKTNIKLKDVAGGAPGGAAGPFTGPLAGAAMKQFGIPKDWQGPLSFVLTYGKQIMEFMGKGMGGKTPPAAEAAPMKPFGKP